QNTIEFRGVEFLWLPDLSRPDPYFVLPIILGVSMFAMQWISAKVTPPNPQMKMMMYFMPAFMVVIFLNLSSGLNLYYAAQNLASLTQQTQITRERQRLPAAKRCDAAHRQWRTAMRLPAVTRSASCRPQ